VTLEETARVAAGIRHACFRMRREADEIEAAAERGANVELTRRYQEKAEAEVKGGWS